MWQSTKYKTNIRWYVAAFLMITRENHAQIYHQRTFFCFISSIDWDCFFISPIVSSIMSCTDINESKQIIILFEFWKTQAEVEELHKATML